MSSVHIAQWAKTRKKFQFQICVWVVARLSKRLKSTFFEKFSNGAALKGRPFFWIFWESSRELTSYLTSTNNSQSVILMEVIRVRQNLNPKFRLKNEYLFLFYVLLQFCCFQQVLYLLGNSSQQKLSLTAGFAYQLHIVLIRPQSYHLL